MLNEDKSPKIIISASGMCEAGRIRHHLKHHLWDSRNSIVFVGYQAEGTLGRMLVEGAKEVKIFGEPIKVGAEIYNLEGFSGHADQKGLLDWLGGFQKEPKHIFLVHGETQSKVDFAAKVKEVLGYDPIVVNGNTEYELETGEVLSREEVLREALDQEDVEKLKEKLAVLKTDLDTVISNAENVVSKQISLDKLTQINNIVQELEKASLNLGASALAEDRDPRPLTEQK